MSNKTLKFIEMKQKDIKVLKEKIWLDNNKKCPVLNKEIPLEKMTLDHAHKKNDEEYDIDKGVIRTALDWRSNAILGKLENSIKRTGLIYEDGFDLPSFLRNAADYFEKGAYVDDNGCYYIHPNECPKPKKLSKRNYNKVKRLYEKEEFIPKRKNQKKKPMPPYPKTGKPTKAIIELFEKYQIELFN